METESKNKYLSVPITESTMRQLDKAAERMGMSRAGVVRKWIKDRLAKKGSRS